MPFVFFVLSLLVFLIGIRTSLKSLKNQTKYRSLNPLHLFVLGVFSALYLALFPLDFIPQAHGVFASLLLPLYHTLQVMLAGYDFQNLYLFYGIGSALSRLYYLYFALLFFIAPLSTFGFILSFFENIHSYLRFSFLRKRNLYVFSCLTERSLVLAASIRTDFPDAVLVFMNVSNQEKEELHDLKIQANGLSAVTFSKEITDLSIRAYQNSQISFYCTSEDESLNLDTALTLIHQLRHREQTNLYVFSTSEEGRLLLDATDFGEMRVRRFHPDRALAQSVIFNHPITQDAIFRNGVNSISALIVGFGGYGKEITKALLWCGQLPNHFLSLHILDRNPAVFSAFQSECPEILEKNGNTTLGEARYQMNFYSGMDVSSYQLHEAIAGLTDTTVVYVSLGNDEINIETAIKLRILFARHQCYPIIRAVVHSTIKADTLSGTGLVNFKQEDYQIEFIGSHREQLSYRFIDNQELEAQGLACHLAYTHRKDEESIEAWQNRQLAATQDFNQSEYLRNSSIATAIHQRYRQAEGVNKETDAIFEHMRWNAYMRTEGYIYSGSPDSSSRNDKAKMHHNLHPYEQLDAESRKKDSVIVDA